MDNKIKIEEALNLAITIIKNFSVVEILSLVLWLKGESITIKNLSHATVSILEFAKFLHDEGFKDIEKMFEPNQDSVKPFVLMSEIKTVSGEFECNE